MKFYKIPYKLENQLSTYTLEELDDIAKDFTLPATDSIPLTVIEENTEQCNRLILNLSELCNLACRYCYAEEGSYGQETCNKNMSLETLKKVVTRACRLYPGGIGQIQFFGGEPLLNKRVLYSAVEWIKEYTEGLGLKCPLFTIVTNGTLIDDECITLFNEYFSSVTISLDGSKAVNDGKRVFKGTHSSVFDKVAETIRRMNERERKYYICIEGTIHEGHIQEFEEKSSMESYKALYQLDVDIIHISPLIGRSDDSGESKINYNKFFEEWVKEEFKNGVGGIKTRTVANLLYAAKQHKTFGNGCGATNTDLASDVNGGLYPCFMFIGGNEYFLGDTKDSIEEQRQRIYEVRQLLKEANNNTECNKCWVKPVCAKSYGHCIGSRYLSNGSVSRPEKEICSISKCVMENIFVQSYEKYGIRKSEED
ncbi:thioether cross-link-forming SCIFF peptide maturase [Anaerocolumna cellulosilytica]|uniref:Thioether cross-link-forming SCIFF peptide maturase n=1 Tax=Anaerocolumna cellulosilytica TaxID=433286 RepID=A0A6S6QRF9_9FIRM|nr:radical SAM protein [Anaerocolumna cellulosilytica]MBB5197619.1 uncharacterized protein [Anaerocolumna cellulosilytica]BCJ93194.1 thioether cross-link-forming SCIFF peptide maturase [Anaerocolumna cellulosilytica]